jgi:hypothetical protein
LCFLAVRSKKAKSREEKSDRIRLKNVLQYFNKKY